MIFFVWLQWNSQTQHLEEEKEGDEADCDSCLAAVKKHCHAIWLPLRKGPAHYVHVNV